VVPVVKKLREYLKVEVILVVSSDVMLVVDWVETLYCCGLRTPASNLAIDALESKEGEALPNMQRPAVVFYQDGTRCTDGVLEKGPGVRMWS